MYKILIADKSEVYQMTEKKILEKNKEFDIKIVTSIKEVKEKLCIDTYDVILLEYQLKDGSSENLINYIREIQNNKHIIIIILTTETSEEVVIDLYDRGIDFYITKPFNLHTMDALINRFYEKSKKNGESL